MAITAKGSFGNNSNNYSPIEEGIHEAICYAVIDLGTQYNETYEKWERKAVLIWELPDIRIDIPDKGNLPKAISKTYTVSLHEKARLRKDLEGWRGKRFTDQELQGFNLENVAGKTAQLQILHTVRGEKTYANIANVLPSKSKKEPENPIAIFSFEDGGPLPENTPEWVIKLMESAKEWKAYQAGGVKIAATTTEETADESPF